MTRTRNAWTTTGRMLVGMLAAFGIALAALMALPSGDAAASVRLSDILVSGRAVDGADQTAAPEPPVSSAVQKVREAAERRAEPAQP